MSLKVDNIIMDPSNDKFKDECGVFGVYSNREMDVASMTYYDYMHFNIEDKKVRE